MKHTLETINSRTQWFREARFGMFIHWGLYSIPGRGEWIRSHQKLSIEDYEPYFRAFDPKEYNPREWAKQAKAAGDLLVTADLDAIRAAGRETSTVVVFTNGDAIK